MIYLLAFCRVTIGLVFALSSFSKARDFAQFQQALVRFQLLSRRLSRLAALLFLGGEGAVVLLIVIGGPALLPGFVLAILLLLIFCAALALVLIRRLRISCHCFGSNNRPVTQIDIWRNVGFLLCAGGGCEALIWTHGVQESMVWMVWLLIALSAGVFVMIWIQLGEIVQLFRLE